MTETRTDAWLGRLLGDRYRLVAPIGAGGFARVYLADDLSLRRQVAVKVLHAGQASAPAFLRRFSAEAQAAASISHPHLLMVHDWGETPDGPYLVTEYLAGGSLRTLLDFGRLLTPAQAVKVGLEASSGLAAAHARGMVHRDIKPANLLFDAGGRLRIADFGLVQAMDGSDLTEPDGVVMGTATYIAPERGRSTAVDGRTDVYSLALSLIESVTGEVPHAGGSVTEIMLRRQEHDIEVPKVFGAAYQALVDAGRALPEHRSTAVQFRDGLVQSTRSFAAPPRLDLVPALPDGAPLYVGEVTRLDVPIGSESDLTHELEPTAILAEAGTPEPRWRPRWKLTVAVAMVLGAVAAVAGYMVTTVQPQGTPAHVVADYTGRPVEDIRAVAELSRWVLDEDQVRTGDAAEGEILAQRPAPGVELAEGELLTVEVAAGPLLVMTPQVIGLDVEAAVMRLEAREFSVATREPRPDEVVPEGQVMEARNDAGALAPGSLAEPGGVVELIVSGGPVPRSVPLLVDLSVEEATAVLAELQLMLVERPDRVFSETILEGVVISQDMFPGLQTERGSSITVVVSKGPDRRIVPNVIGMTIADATAALEEVGLSRSGVTGSGDIVTSTEPAIGTSLPPGSQVLLWVPAN